jgi:hypothetical protein
LHVSDDEPEKLAQKPKPETAKPISQVAWEAQDEESQAYLKGLADEVKGYLALPDVKMAVAKIDDAKLSADEKTAIWYLFDSKQRSAMKTYQDNQKADQ